MRLGFQVPIRSLSASDLCQCKRPTRWKSWIWPLVLGRTFVREMQSATPAAISTATHPPASRDLTRSFANDQLDLLELLAVDGGNGLPATSIDDPTLEDSQIQALDHDWLHFQAAVEDPVGAGTRLVDRPIRRHDFQLWESLLQYRSRIDDVKGVRAIWEALMQRRLVLPVSGSEADSIWRLVLSAAAQDDDLLGQVIRYCRAEADKGLGAVWPYFFETLMIELLRRTPRKSFQVLLDIEKWCPRPAGYLHRIVLESPSSPSVLRSLRPIYKRSSVRDLYATIMPLLFRRGRINAAYRWHQFLSFRNDVSLEAIQGYEHLLPRLTVKRGGRVVPKALQRKPPTAADQVVVKTESPEGSRLTEFLMQMLSHSNNPISDRFCARYFATTAASVDVVLSGMQLLGVEKLGPLALRELAVREGSAEALHCRIESMAAKGIRLDGSRFALLARKFAADGENELLEDLVSSDQHPDELANMRLQRSLLAMYLETNNVRQIRKTLAVLTILKDDVRTLECNYILQGYILRHNATRAMQVLNGMHEANIPVTFGSSRDVAESQSDKDRWRKLPRRFRERHPARPAAVSVMLRLLQSGSRLDPRRWHLVIRQLGQSTELLELEKLVLWLATFYGTGGHKENRLSLTPARLALTSSTRMPTSVHLPVQKITGYPAYPLQDIFTLQLQQEMVALGLRRTRQLLCHAYKGTRNPASVFKQLLRTKPFLLGLRLIKILVEKGLPVRRGFLVEGFLRQLARLEKILASPTSPGTPPIRLSRDQIETMTRDGVELCESIDLDGLRRSSGVGSSRRLRRRRRRWRVVSSSTRVQR